MHYYYLRAAKTTGTDTIYVVEASDVASAAHLVGHLGCVCITREQTLQAVEDSRHAKLETIAFRRGRDAESLSDAELAAMVGDEHARVACTLRFFRCPSAKSQARRASLDRPH